MLLSRSQFIAACLAGLALLQVPVLAQNAPAKISLRLDWKASGQHSPFYLGKARGYFSAEGIDLDIITGSGSSDAVKQLGASAVNFALVDALVLVQAAEQEVPVKSIAGYYQRTPIVVLSPKSKPVTQPSQLTNGVKLGAKRASASYQGLVAMLASNRIDQKNVNLFDVGFGVQPLLVGQVGALMGFTMNEAIEAESAGMPVHELLVADHGVQTYGLMLATSTRFLADKPELVRAFLRATRKSVEAATSDKRAAIEALAKAGSEIDVPRELKVLAKAEPFWFTKDGGPASFGTQTMQGWTQTLETAKRVGLVERPPAAKDLFVGGLDK